MRINARLDDDYAGKLEYLRRRTGTRTSDVIRDAIDLYYREMRKPVGNAAQVLRDAGYIGCGEAEPDFSANYKKTFADDLDQKHGDR